MPFNWDESAFALAAREVLHGHLPYTTFFDDKPVGSTVLMAAWLGVAGQSVEAVRLLGLVCVVATSWCVYLIARHFDFGRAVNLSAAALYIAFSTRLYGSATMTEIMLAPFSAAAVLALLRVPRATKRAARLGLAALAGLLFGVAVWIKYVPAAPAGCVGIVCLVEMIRRHRAAAQEVACAAALFAAGVVLPTLATVLCYWFAGLLPTFWYANFGYIGRYIAREDTAAYWLLETALAIWPLAGLALLVLLPSVARGLLCRQRRYPALMLAAWLIGEAIAVVAPMHFYPYYFLMMLPPLSVLAALVIWQGVAATAMPAMTGRAMRACAIAVALVALVPHGVDAARALARPDIPRKIAALARQRLRNWELIYVVNDQPVIYLLAGTALPTRYAYPTHLLGSQRFLVPEDRLAELRRILDLRPRMIVVNEANGWTGPVAETDPVGRAMVEKALADAYESAALFTSRDGTVQSHVYIRVR